MYQKQGLKNGPVQSITVDQFATGPLFFWTGPHTALPHIPNFLGGSKSRAEKGTGLFHYSGPICNWTGPQTGPFFSGLDHKLDHFFSGPDHTLDRPIFQISWEGQSISVDQFATGLDHGLDNFFISLK